MKRMIFALLCSLLALSAQAAQIARCEDAQGRVTYSQHGCSPDQTQRTQTAANARPSGSERGTTMHNRTEPRPAIGDFRSQGIGSADDGCGNLLDSSSKRASIIRGQVRAGMNQRDVESALGKPERISRQNGTTRFHYPARNGRAQQVSFDENGCVKSKR